MGAATTRAGRQRERGDVGGCERDGGRDHLDVGVEVDVRGERGAAGDFSVVAEGGEDMKIYPLGDGAVLDASAFITLLGDGPLVQDPESGGRVTAPSSPVTSTSQYPSSRRPRRDQGKISRSPYAAAMRCRATQ